MDRCTHHGDIVAVRDGVILRSPRQEAAYLFVNSANEHIRFRYLHMNPRKMDADNLLSGRRVHEGEVIGEVSNFSMKEAGTSYHVHFDIQVPTKYGWVFVNPYMTLVDGLRTADRRTRHRTGRPERGRNRRSDQHRFGVTPRVEPDRPKRPTRQPSRSRGEGKAAIRRRRAARRAR